MASIRRTERLVSLNGTLNDIVVEELIGIVGRLDDGKQQSQETMQVTICVHSASSSISCATRMPNLRKVIRKKVRQVPKLESPRSSVMRLDVDKLRRVGMATDNICADSGFKYLYPRHKTRARLRPSAARSRTNTHDGSRRAGRAPPGNRAPHGSCPRLARPHFPATPVCFFLSVAAKEANPGSTVAAKFAAATSASQAPPPPRRLRLLLQSPLHKSAAPRSSQTPPPTTTRRNPKPQSPPVRTAPHRPLRVRARSIEMKFVAAYLLAYLGAAESAAAVVAEGEEESAAAAAVPASAPTKEDVLRILASVGADAEGAEDRLDMLFAQLEGKDVADLLTAGREQLAYAPSGASAAAFAVGGAAGGPAAAAAADEAAEKEEEGEEDELVFNLFDEEE
ncbi:hypothetical protein HU200_015687 [Digitaria exilis]|uniref:60S acidic ribosomal protein P2 n=1 Tax=Digitaria exilis TaxID=1010633 RepID=A0A835F8H0_9POAL|nr:hypothetical protein HU200_015687 [Digitaria exilis]